MSFKPFFVHFSRPVSKHDNSRLRHAPRGFTAYITPSDKPRTVNVQATFCSSKDEFKKREGRSLAPQADKAEFNPRELPKLLAAMTAACAPVWASNETDYLYVLKYVV